MVMLVLTCSWLLRNHRAGSQHKDCVQQLFGGQSGTFPPTQRLLPPACLGHRSVSSRVVRLTLLLSLLTLVGASPSRDPGLRPCASATRALNSGSASACKASASDGTLLLRRRVLVPLVIGWYMLRQHTHAASPAARPSATSSCHTSGVQCARVQCASTKTPPLVGAVA